MINVCGFYSAIALHLPTSVNYGQAAIQARGPHAQDQRRHKSPQIILLHHGVKLQIKRSTSPNDDYWQLSALVLGRNDPENSRPRIEQLPGINGFWESLSWD